MVVIIKMLIMGIAFFIQWQLLRTVDNQYGSVEERKGPFIAVVVYFVLAAFIRQEELFKDVLQVLFWVSLAVASYCDFYTFDIPDIVFIPAGAVAILLLLTGDVSGMIVAELLVFIALQWLLFSRMYGAADCIAFCVCAMYLAASGCRLQEHLYMMFITFLLLAIVQLRRRNINKKGNLKEPVALLPYISAAVLLVGGVCT